MEKIFIPILIFVGCIPIAFGEVTIQNDQQYVGDDGSLHIVGEIENNLEIPLNQINVLVTLLDSNNEIIAKKQTSSLVNTVMPGMKSPFDLVLTDNKSKQATSYLLELDYAVSAPKSQVIDITKSEITKDNYNNLMITGTVTNKGEITANMVSVVATLYDRQGNVAGVTKTHPEPDYLMVEDEAFFVLTMPDKIQTTEIRDYTLVAESEEYAAVPEFPIGTMILLAGTFSAYIGITRYSSKITANLIPVTNLK